MEFFNFTENSWPILGGWKLENFHLIWIEFQGLHFLSTTTSWYETYAPINLVLLYDPKSTGFLSIDLHHLQSGSALQSTHPMTIHHQNLRVFPPEPFNHPLKIHCPNNACDIFLGGVALGGIHLNFYESSFVSKATGPQDKDRQQRFLTMLHQLGIGTGFRS